MKVKLMKLKELDDALVPNNIIEGYTTEGTLLNEPVVGECVYISRSVSSMFRSSTVQEIIDQDTFKTFNSIYRIIRL